MKVATQEPLTVSGDGVYQRSAAEGGGPITRKDGSPARWISFAEFRDSDHDRQVPVHGEFRDDLPKAGEVVRALLDVRVDQVAKNSATGSPYIANVLKLSLMGWTKAST